MNSIVQFAPTRIEFVMQTFFRLPGEHLPDSSVLDEQGDAQLVHK